MGSCIFMRPALSCPTHRHILTNIAACTLCTTYTRMCSSLPRLRGKAVKRKYVHSPRRPPSFHCSLACTYKLQQLTKSHLYSQLRSPRNVHRHSADIYTHRSIFALPHSLHPRLEYAQTPLQTSPSTGTAHDIMPRVQKDTCCIFPNSPYLSLHALGVPTSAPDHAIHPHLGTASAPRALSAVVTARAPQSQTHGPGLEPVPTHSPRCPWQSCSSGNLGQGPRGSGDSGLSLRSGPAMPFFK